MCGEQVDGVPPGDSGEQVPHHGQESGRAVRHIPAQVVDGEVVVLALGQPPAAQRDRGAVRLVRAGHSCQHGAGQGAANGRGHAQERRHVLHVRPESDGPLGVGRGGVFEGDPLQYRVGEGAVRRVRNRPGCDAHETHHTAITHICRLVSPDARCHHPLWGHRHGLSPDRRRRTRRRRRRTGRADRLRRACDESAAVAVVPALPARRPAGFGRDDGGAVPAAAVADERLAASARGAAVAVAYAVAYGLCTVAFVPRPLLNLAAGALFGSQLGLASALAGTVLGAGVAFCLGRVLGQEALRPLLRGKWLKAADGQLSRHGFRTMLAMRLFPGCPSRRPTTARPCPAWVCSPSCWRRGSVRSPTPPPTSSRAPVPRRRPPRLPDRAGLHRPAGARGRGGGLAQAAPAARALSGCTARAEPMPTRRYTASRIMALARPPASHMVCRP